MAKRTTPDSEPILITLDDIENALDGQPNSAADPSRHGETGPDDPERTGADDPERTDKVSPLYQPDEQSADATQEQTRESVTASSYLARNDENEKSTRNDLARAWGVRPEVVRLVLLKSFVSSKGRTVSDIHLTMAAIVTQIYRLNPILKEVYFRLSKDGLTVVPIIGVEGFAKILDRSGKLNGLSFRHSRDADGRVTACECTLWLKGCDNPIVNEEMYSECRMNTEPWAKSPHRMMRNRTFCQTVRLALAVNGVYEEDDESYSVERRSAYDKASEIESLVPRLTKSEPKRMSLDNGAADPVRNSEATRNGAADPSRHGAADPSRHGAADPSRHGAADSERNGAADPIRHGAADTAL